MKETVHDAAMAREDHVQLYAVLEKMARDAAGLVAKQTATPQEIRDMAVYLTDIRRLLTELSLLPDPADGWGMPREISRYLAGRFLELEGRVKELRNDLARPGGGLQL